MNPDIRSVLEFARYCKGRLGEAQYFTLKKLSVKYCAIQKFDEGSIPYLTGVPSCLSR